jgi:hypothetical protein
MPARLSDYRVPWQSLLKISALLLLIVAANVVASWVTDALKLEIRPSNEDVVHRMIMVAAALYAALIAMPFVPGIEVGLALIGMLGPAIVPLVYVCTLAGLAMSFLVGRAVSLRWLIKLLSEIGFRRASRLLGTIEPMRMADRLGFLVLNAPNRLVPLLLRHRYLALAIVLNLPGNVLLGGGGGIALLAGISRLYSVPGFLGTIACAVAPVPLAVVMFGNAVLPAS